MSRMTWGNALFWVRWTLGWPIWVVCAALFVPAWAAGIVLTLVATLRGKYSLVVEQANPHYEWTQRWMRWWQTERDGCVPQWYLTSHGGKRPLWLSMWIFSAFRNPVGGNPLHAKAKPIDIQWRGSSIDPLHKALSDGGRQWLATVWGWRVGIWVVWPIKKKSATDHYELRFGWKLVPSQIEIPRPAAFTPWDSGRRIA
jgi:hypothetical protein